MWSMAAPRDDDASEDAPELRPDPLLGRRILIVEDDPYIAFALEEGLTEAGMVVIGAARTIDDAMRHATMDDFDMALLDINIGPARTDVVAEALAARARPFVFVTGSSRAGLPEAYFGRPVVEKPFFIEQVLRALRDAMEK